MKILIYLFFLTVTAIASFGIPYVWFWEIKALNPKEFKALVLVEGASIFVTFIALFIILLGLINLTGGG